MAKLSVDQTLLKAKSHTKRGEIEEAHWYDIHDLPVVPSAKVSVAGELIEHYVKTTKSSL